MSAAQALKDFRKSQIPPLSQQGLAEKVGVTRETVGRWEAGLRKVDTDLLPRVSDETGIPRSVLRPDLAESLGV